jgi:predicted Zn-dependent protease
MRSRTIHFLVFAVLVTVRSSFAASAGRDAAYERLRDEERVTQLVEQVSDDIGKRRLDAALKKAEAAVALAPGNSTALNAKGAALVELKRYDEAAKVLAAAVANDPQNFPAQFNQAEILSLQKKYAEAATEFTSLKSHFGDMPVLKYKIFLCDLLGGREDEAREALRDLRYPTDGVAWYFAHIADDLKAGRRAEAKKLLAAAQAIHGDATVTYRETLEDIGLLK